MTTFGLALVLAAAVCHAVWNVFAKRINGGPELIWLFSVLSLIIYAPMALWIVVVERPVFGLWQVGFLIGSALLHLGYFLLLLTGYRKGDLSLVYPTARATGPLLSATFAIFFLGETITAQTAVGAVIIVAGVFFLTGGIKLRREGASSSLLFGLAAGTFIGSYTAWDAYTVSALLVPPLLLDYASSIGRAVFLAPVANRRRATIAKHWREHRLGVIAIAVFNPLAYILVLYAMTFTPVVFVAPLRETSVLLTVLAGSILLGEGRLKERLGWSAFIVSGVALLASA